MKKVKRIYLDNAATTLPEKSVLEVMKRSALETYGNPSSIHHEGVLAKAVLEIGRKTIADVLRAEPDEIIFTGGGTEANNMAIFGATEGKKGHVIVSAIEHPSVLECVRELERRGMEVTYLLPENDGVLLAKSVKEALRDDTVLVSVMYANNEIGTVQPIREIAKAIRLKTENVKLKTRPLFHTDACQATNYLEMNVLRLGVDLMTLNASKIYGPKGIGALFMKRGTKLSPAIFGGGQERGIRPGTENVAAAAGFAEALRITEEVKEKESERLRILRDFFIHSVLSKIPGAVLHGSRDKRLPNNVNFSFPKTDAEELVIKLDARGIACSTGSACANIGKNGEISHVLLALGCNADLAAGAVRFTLGRNTTKTDIQHTVAELVKILKTSRA